MKKRKNRILPEPKQSQSLILCIPPSQVGLFRFVMEAHDHVAMFTVLDKHKALIKLLHSPHGERAVQNMLQSMQNLVDVQVIEQIPFEK